jgi:hypothetical protein
MRFLSCCAVSALVFSHAEAASVPLPSRFSRVPSEAMGVVVTPQTGVVASGAAVESRPTANLPAFDAVSSPALVGPKIIAVQLVAVDAAGLPCLMGRGAVTAHKVFPVRDRLKVARVAARTVPAKMVDLQPVRNRPDEHRVRSSVRLPSLALPLRVAVSRSLVAVAGVRPASVRMSARGFDVPLKNRRLQSSSLHALIYSQRASKAIDRGAA